MAVQAIDHIYVKTRRFDHSLAFWERLGFRPMARWNDEPCRGSRLTSGETFVILEERTEEEPQTVVHFRIVDAERYTAAVGGSGVEVETAVEESHWGTRWMRVNDPEGRVFALEDTKPPRERAAQTSVFDVDEDEQHLNIRPLA